MNGGGILKEMSNKLFYLLLVSTFSSVTAVMAIEPGEIIPAYDTDVSCNSFFDPSIMSDPGVITLAPVFEVNHYECAPGYYLPSDSEVCKKCPGDSYCTGGDYTYDYYITQGVSECPGEKNFAPSGANSIGDCGRMLHIGGSKMYLSSTRRTTPSLNFDTDDDHVPDLFANMTLKDVPMSYDTDKRLKVEFNGRVYSIYDNTIDPSGQY